MDQQPSVKMIDFLTAQNIQEYGNAVIKYFTDNDRGQPNSLPVVEVIDAHSFKVTDSRGAFLIRQDDNGVFKAAFIPNTDRMPMEIRKMNVLDPKNAVLALEAFIKAFRGSDYEENEDAAIAALEALGYTQVGRFSNGSGGTLAVAFTNKVGAEFLIRISQPTDDRHIEESLASIRLAGYMSDHDYAAPIAVLESAQAFPYLKGLTTKMPNKLSGGSFDFVPAETIELIDGIMIDIVETRGYTEGRDLNKTLAEIG